MSEFQITSIRICIDRKEPEYKGRIYGIGVENEETFINKDDLVWQIGEIYKKIGRPQPVLVERSFSDNAQVYNSFVGEPARYHSSESIEEKKGLLDTVDLIMVSMKHAEWQGLLKNEDGSIRATFSTMLECIEKI